MGSSSPFDTRLCCDIFLHYYPWFCLRYLLPVAGEGKDEGDTKFFRVSWYVMGSTECPVLSAEKKTLGTQYAALGTEFYFF